MLADNKIYIFLCNYLNQFLFSFLRVNEISKTPIFGNQKYVMFPE